MAETVYAAVTWTAGDIITEAKMDNMVANDRAVDAMADGIELTERADPSTPAANKLHIFAKDKAGIPTLYVINDAGTIYELASSKPTFTWSVVGTLTTGTSVSPIIGVPRTLTAIKAYLYVKTAPTGADVIVDINKNGTSIWATTPADRPKILAGATSGNTTSFDTTALAEGDILIPDIDQIGSTIAGTDITIQLKSE